MRTGEWETTPTNKLQSNWKGKNPCLAGRQGEMSMQLISHAHLQLRLGDVDGRCCPVRRKASPKSMGRTTPGAGEVVGHCSAKGSQPWQGPEEPVWGGVAAAAGAASVLHAGREQHQQRVEEPAWR